MKPGVIIALLICMAGNVLAADVEKIGQEVLAIDKRLDSYLQTLEETCEQSRCVTRVKFWDESGRLRKEVEKITDPPAPARVIGRYYQRCRLILVRVAPADPASVKTSFQTERYYFHKGKLLRVEFGAEVKTFSKAQQADYQRTYGFEPTVCINAAARALK